MMLQITVALQFSGFLPIFCSLSTLCTAVVVIAYIVVVCCLRAAPADVAAAYQPVSQSDGAEASAASRV